MLEELVEGAELLPGHGDGGALEELVVVDEEPDLARPLLGRDVQEGRPVVRGRRGLAQGRGRSGHRVRQVVRGGRQFAWKIIFRL